MNLSADTLWTMSDIELLSTYHDARRQYVEKKFARDTQRARLDWLRARAFAAGSGGVTERRNSVDVSEELARKGQDVREMTRDLDLLRADVDLIEMSCACAARCRRPGSSLRKRAKARRRTRPEAHPAVRTRPELHRPAVAQNWRAGRNKTANIYIVKISQ